MVFNKLIIPSVAVQTLNKTTTEYISLSTNNLINPYEITSDRIGETSQTFRILLIIFFFNAPAPCWTVLIPIIAVLVTWVNGTGKPKIEAKMTKVAPVPDTAPPSSSENLVIFSRLSLTLYRQG